MGRYLKICTSKFWKWNFLWILLLSFGLLVLPPQLSAFVKDSWTFVDKQGNPIVIEWCGASDLESVRSIYVDPYMHEDLYLAFFDEADKTKAREILNASWDHRKARYQNRLESTPPEAYFAIAKKNGHIVGFVIFDTELFGEPKGVSLLGRFPPKEVCVSPLMILPEAQGAGLGKELLFSILKPFPNLNKISLATAKTLPAAEFYYHLGFKEVDNEVGRERVEDEKFKELIIFFEWTNLIEGF